MICAWKCQYRRRKLVLTVAGMTGARFGIRLFVYKCPECGWWYLTHVARKESAA